jgi:uncharacterized protein
MSRPKKYRCINCSTSTSCFKPKGIPVVQLEEVYLNLDEFEAIRLADYDGLYHDKAAEQINISRATFGRILEKARQKVANVIMNGKALQIETTKKTTEVNQ